MKLKAKVFDHPVILREGYYKWQETWDKVCKDYDEWSANKDIVSFTAQEQAVGHNHSLCRVQLVVLYREQNCRR